MSDYMKIDWADMWEGDVLMHENGDRLTVTGVNSDVGEVHASGIWRREESLRGHGFSPHRKVDPLPTEPGAYRDKDGDYWLLDKDGDWYCWATLRGPELYPDNPNTYGPFTRLVPMPSSDAVLDVVQKAEPMCRRERITDAVMALLRGGDDE